MKQYQLQADFAAPCVALGCMRIANMEAESVRRLIETAVALGVNYFDHADIYGGGQSEARFGEVLFAKPSLREKVLIQTKCGIRQGYYDSSYQHIVSSVEASLRRLRTDYLDALLIHRPDALAEPEEIARAFEDLHTAGKVRYFGVSNHNPMQIELLQAALPQKLLFNQMQMSVVHTGMLDQGFQVNTDFPGAVDKDGAVLDYCKLKKIVLQAWSPFQHGFIEGVFLDNPQFPEVNAALQRIAPKYHIAPTGLAVAWLLRVPVMMQVIVGTTSETRLREIAAGAEVSISREDFYEIYRAAGNVLP